MALAVNDRVIVSNQNSAYRKSGGTVKAVDGADISVRIDGHPAESTVLFREAELQSSTLPCPLEYAD